MAGLISVVKDPDWEMTKQVIATTAEVYLST